MARHELKAAVIYVVIVGVTSSEPWSPALCVLCGLFQRVDKKPGQIRVATPQQQGPQAASDHASFESHPELGNQLGHPFPFRCGVGVHDEENVALELWRAGQFEQPVSPKMR